MNADTKFNHQANKLLARLPKIKFYTVGFYLVGILVVLITGIEAKASEGCTIGVANGYITADGRPIMWKVRDTSDERQQLIHSSGSPYDYIGVRSEGSVIYMGLNEAGIASGNSLVNPSGLPNTNSSTQRYILRNYDSLDQIRDYFQLKVEPYSNSGRGCFPFIDVAGNAILFELNGPDWWLEYNSMDPDRETQDLFGFVVRANEFHQRSDGTDDTSIGGRYESGTYNVSGMVGLDMLCTRTIIQGNNGPNSGFEFVRYGPGRPLASISRSINRSTIVVHGVAPDEEPALATMWVILGQSNYGIAVPVWVRVSDIPQCLSSGEMYDRAKSLYDKGNEITTQASTFPVEAHMFDVVNSTFLPHWRANGVPSVAEMTCIEHQMASDAYSLLDCLDNHQSDNKAPDVTFNTLPDGLTLNFKLVASDSDGTIDCIEWNFGDNQTSTEEMPSHTYAESGTYLVSCTVTDDDGVSITDWRYYVVPVDCDLAGDDGVVDFGDLAEFSAHWLGTNCSEPNWCEGTDFDRSTTVDFVDFAIFADHWLTSGVHLGSYPSQIIEEIQAPDDITAGLAYDGNYLWCAGRASQRIYKVNPNNGNVLMFFETPGYHAAGLAWDNGKLWHVDGRTRKMYRINPIDGAIEVEWPLVGSDPTGIIVHQDKIYISDWCDSLTYVYDKETGTLITSQTPALDCIWGSTRDNNYFWFVSPYGDEVFAVEPQRWQLVASLPIVLEGATGAATDGDCIWIASHVTDTIYKYRIRGEKCFSVRYWKELNFIRVLSYKNTGLNLITQMALHEVLPIDMPNQKIEILNSVFEPLSNEVIIDDYGQRRAEYIASNIESGDFFQVAYAIPLRFGELRYVVFPDQVGNVNDIPESFRTEWTGDILIHPDAYDMNDPIVQQAAVESVGDETNVFWMVMSIHDYVIDHITYGQPANKPVGEVLESGVGVCGDFARTMVALCRLNGIPARHLHGQNHETTEVWMPGPDVWYPIDPTGNRLNERNDLWQNRCIYGTSKRIINHMVSRSDYWFWEPDLIPELGTSYELAVGEYVGDSWNNNYGPVYSGHREEPVVIGDKLHLQIYPAFDPEGDYPIFYKGFVTTDQNSSPEGEPDFILSSTDSVVQVFDIPHSSKCYVRLIPVDSQGNECPIYREQNEFNVLVKVLEGDIDSDGIVDTNDLTLLSNQWLQPPAEPSADIAPVPYGDNMVNFLDFAILARHWLESID